MAINRVPYPNALPTEQNDYVKQNDLLETGFLRVNDPVAFDNALGVVLQGAIFQCGGTVYRCDGNTAIGGAVSRYVQLAPAGGGATLTPTYVANLAGVSWNQAYNGYYDGLGNLYVFDEGRAMISGEIAAVVGRYLQQHRNGDAYVGRDLVAGRNINIKGAADGNHQIDFASDAYIQWLEASDSFFIPKKLSLTGAITLSGGIANLVATAANAVNIGAGATWGFPTGGIYQVVVDDANLVLEINVLGVWRTGVRANGMINAYGGAGFVRIRNLDGFVAHNLYYQAF